ncbi:NAD(P)/FAD-dependent oxidoreductase [Sphaerisporangium sp. B11E5]|uniref:NAD(P)/FAD-dependent oxidoreductase n=1 Tax=Sphaerisporangium sp. B11E5 TaxID=3153563 RepID=UPI00325DFAD9
MSERDQSPAPGGHSVDEPVPALDGRRYDVVVIGGGAAGLSGALTLGRARRSVLVADAGQQRNAPASHVHTYLTRDGTPPGDLLAAGRAEVTRYGGHIAAATVTALSRRPSGDFAVTLEPAPPAPGGATGATVLAARLLVATGLVDELPGVDGLAGRFGRDVLHCPYCHGWEVRDQTIGVLATGPLSVHQALLWRQWSPDVTFFRHTAEELGPDEAEQLAARDVTVVDGLVTSLEVTGDRLSGVRLDDGRVIPVHALAVATRLTARADLLAPLGLTSADRLMGPHVIGTHIPADPTGATAVPGVFVAGNVTDPMEQVIGAAWSGVRAAAALNADLINEETRAAVAARREAAPVA